MPRVPLCRKQKANTKTMKTRLLISFAALVLVLLGGCSLALYPFALMFGGPTESTLVDVRRNLAELQRTYPTADHVLMPTYLMVDRTPSWSDETARDLRFVLDDQLGLTSRCDSVPPSVPFGELGVNQMRFLWNQADVYADWVRATQPTGNYFWFTEIFRSDSSGVYAIQCYIVTKDGGIAYARLMNSHQFDPTSVRTTRDALRTLLNAFQAAMHRDPEEQYPPYGVG